jgi:hypothetical protein
VKPTIDLHTYNKSKYKPGTCKHQSVQWLGYGQEIRRTCVPLMAESRVLSLRQCVRTEYWGQPYLLFNRKQGRLRRRVKYPEQDAGYSLN